MQKPVGSAIAATLFLFGLVSGFLDFIEKTKTAVEIYDFTVANVSVHVHWPTIYLFMTILGACLFVALNWNWVMSQFSAWRKRNTRKWDQALLVAMNQIILRSNTRQSFKTGSEISDAITMVGDYARCGKITIAGKRADSGLLEPITKQMWKSAKLFGGVKTDHYERDELVEINLVEKGDNKKIVMSGLMVDYSQIHGLIK